MVISVSSQKIKRIRPKLTSGQKEARREKFTNLTHALDTARNKYQEEAQTISATYGRTMKWTRGQLFLQRMRRKPNPWNAFVTERLDEANADLAVGERYRLTKFIAEHREELLHDYGKLSKAERGKLADKVIDMREEKTKVARANPKALQLDVNSTFKAMERQWTGICQRTGVQGFYVAVRGDIEDYHEPKVFCSDKAINFFKDVLNTDPRQLAVKLEAWAVSGIDNDRRPAKPKSRAKIISSCRTHIQDELDATLRENKYKAKVTMNYENYEGKIVERYGVALQGWPCGEIRNPSKVGSHQEVTKLLEALKSGECRWVTLSDEEIAQRKATNKARQARGETVYKSRKEGPRKRKSGKKSAKSAAIVESDLDDEEEHEPPEDSDDD